MNPQNHLGAAGAAAIGLTTPGSVEVGDSGTSGLSRRVSSGLSRRMSSGLAGEPPEPGTFTYEESAGTVVEWTEAWAKHVAAD